LHTRWKEWRSKRGEGRVENREKWQRSGRVRQRSDVCRCRTNELKLKAKNVNEANIETGYELGLRSPSPPSPSPLISLLSLLTSRQLLSALLSSVCQLSISF